MFVKVNCYFKLEVRYGGNESKREGLTNWEKVDLTCHIQSYMDKYHQKTENGSVIWPRKLKIVAQEWSRSNNVKSYNIQVIYSVLLVLGIYHLVLLLVLPIDMHCTHHPFRNDKYFVFYKIKYKNCKKK